MIQYIAHVVKKRAESIGYNPVDFAGHSLRRGGITTAVRKGARIDSIIAQSAHKSAQMVIKYTEQSDKFNNYALDGVL